MSDCNIIVQQRGHARWITIDREQRRNALDLATMASLVEAFLEAGDDKDVRAIILTGSGERAFCAGADLKEADELARQGKSYPHPMTGPGRNLFEVILEMPKPTIAAINGTALGAGCELALACDIRLMSEIARIGLPEARRGMGANFGSVLLPRLIPRALAFDMLYSGRELTAGEALEIGLVNRVLPPPLFRDEAARYVDMIAGNAPLTLQRYKQMAVKGWELPVHSALRLDVGPNPYLSSDREEGVRAFLERRAPRWRGC